MSSIKINNLQPTGSDLFNDSENYLNELSERETGLVNGGCIITITIRITIRIF